MSKVDRLKQELLETQTLLKSPRVNGSTREVLERLSDDLKRQIGELERVDAGTLSDIQFNDI